MVTCSKLPHPENGNVSWNSTDFNSIASYSCNEGFVLNRIPQRVCQASGYWSDRPPQCSRIPRPSSTPPSSEDMGLHPLPSSVYTAIQPVDGTARLQQPNDISSIVSMSNATRSHHTNNTNIFIICGGVIVLMINLIIVVAVLIAVVYIRRRKMNALAAAAANSVENPLYSGGQLDRMQGSMCQPYGIRYISKFWHN